MKDIALDDLIKEDKSKFKGQRKAKTQNVLILSLRTKRMATEKISSKSSNLNLTEIIKKENLIPRNLLLIKGNKIKIKGMTEDCL